MSIHLKNLIAAVLSVALLVPVTASAAPGDVVIAAAGDIATTKSGDTQTAAVISALNPDAVLALGDLCYSTGTLACFNSLYDDTWGAFKAKTHPAPGNHEYRTSNAAGYRGYWGFSGPLWYSFDIGAWHIISLDSQVSHSASSAQTKWLKADLAANPSLCTLAFWHEPRWSSGSHHGSDASVQPLWDALDAANADVILNGHEHNYERFAPIQGIREFVVGTGGRSSGGDFGNPLPTSQVRNNSAFGVLKMTLGTGSYSWQFLPVAGESFSDLGSGTCQP